MNENGRPATPDLDAAEQRIIDRLTEVMRSGQDGLLRAFTAFADGTNALSPSNSFILHPLEEPFYDTEDALKAYFTAIDKLPKTGSKEDLEALRVLRRSVDDHLHALGLDFRFWAHICRKK
jgi:hypothetical protein